MIRNEIKTISTLGEMRNSCIIVAGKPEDKKPLGRSRRRREDNIKVDLEEIGCKDAFRIYVAQDRTQWRVVVNTVQ